MTSLSDNNTDQRIGALEGRMETVVVLLEGEPVHDIDGLKIGTEGGIVRQNEQNAEALHVISHTLTNIEIQLNNVRKPWSRGQRIAASGVFVTFLLGSLPTIAWLVS